MTTKKLVKHYRISRIKPTKQFYEKLSHINYDTSDRNIPAYLSYGYYKNFTDYCDKTGYSRDRKDRYICHKFFHLE